ncbi:MAG: hypothetical protein U0133_15745 [Gemmatimonadales bacterium]
MHVRYRAALAAVTAALLQVGSRIVLEHGAFGLGARVLLSLLPVAVMGLFCVFAVQIVRSFDELETRIHLEGALFSLLGTALATMGAGVLTREGLLPTLSLGLAWPWLWSLAFFLWGIGCLVAGARYR